METLLRLVDGVLSLLPTAAAIAGIILVLYVIRRILVLGEKRSRENRFRNQIIMLGLAIAGLLIVILGLPIEDTSRGSLLGLIGIVLSAAIALSSTTFLGNAMAGIMLRVVRNFRMGDFIRVGEHFGRVSERGLVHTEIQTEDRDLTTLPNLYLVTNPVTVIRSSGTIISATVSIGYDEARSKVKKLLLEAAEKAELKDPFVQILNLGDYSVTYRVAGLLADTKLILSTRSKLRGLAMDALHGGGVEIVSPQFMNTRALPVREHVIPEDSAQRAPEPPPTDAPSPEQVVFDKAEEAESLEKQKQERERSADDIDKLRQEIKAAKEAPYKDRLETRLRQLETQHEKLQRTIETTEAKVKEPDRTGSD